jgi:hypothetical protein
MQSSPQHLYSLESLLIDIHEHEHGGKLRKFFLGAWATLLTSPWRTLILVYGFLEEPLRPSPLLPVQLKRVLATKLCNLLSISQSRTTRTLSMYAHEFLTWSIFHLG